MEDKYIIYKWRWQNSKIARQIRNYWPLHFQQSSTFIKYMLRHLLLLLIWLASSAAGIVTIWAIDITETTTPQGRSVKNTPFSYTSHILEVISWNMCSEYTEKMRVYFRSLYTIVSIYLGPTLISFPDICCSSSCTESKHSRPCQTKQCWSFLPG